MLNETIIEEIENKLETMYFEDQLEVFTAYCESNNYYDDIPYSVENINELAEGLSPLEVLEKYGDIDTNWEYFNYNGCGNVQEWDGIEDYSEIAEYMARNEECFGDCDIEKLIELYWTDIEDYVEEVKYNSNYDYENKSELFNLVKESLESDYNISYEFLSAIEQSEIVDYVFNSDDEDDDYDYED